MLEGATAIPYNDELISILIEACKSYKCKDEFVRVEELVVAFVTGNIPFQFQNHIRSAMKEYGFDEIPTDGVFVRLAQYVVLNTIINNEDELRQAICASKLMNYMLVVKALKRSVPNMNFLLKAYNYHLSRYLVSVDKLQENSSTKLRCEIPKAEFPLEVSEKDANALRLVFKEAELYRIERLLTSYEIQNIDNPFVKVYVGLSRMFDCLSYCFYNLDLNRVIELLIGEKDDKRRRKLSKIIEEISQAKYGFDDTYCKTSVILAMMNGEEQDSVGDLILPIKEFAVYLYYELLTEKIIGTLN